MNQSNPQEHQSVLVADLGRAMLAAQVRSRAEKDLPTLTKAELSDLLFEQVGLNKTVMVGNTLSISAGDEITIECGKSLIHMDKDGNVTIKGTRFNFESSGPVQITGKDIDLN